MNPTPTNVDLFKAVQAAIDNQSDIVMYSVECVQAQECSEVIAEMTQHLDNDTAEIFPGYTTVN